MDASKSVGSIHLCLRLAQESKDVTTYTHALIDARLEAAFFSSKNHFLLLA